MKNLILLFILSISIVEIQAQNNNVYKITIMDSLKKVDTILFSNTDTNAVLKISFAQTDTSELNYATQMYNNVVVLPIAIYEAWKMGGFKGKGVALKDVHSIRIFEPIAYIENISLKDTIIDTFMVKSFPIYYKACNALFKIVFTKNDSLEEKHLLKVNFNNTIPESTYRPMVEKNKTWYSRYFGYYEISSFPPRHMQFNFSNYAYTGEDSIINNINYTALYFSSDNNPEFYYTIFFREDTSTRVVYYLFEYEKDKFTDAEHINFDPVLGDIYHTSQMLAYNWNTYNYEDLSDLKYLAFDSISSLTKEKGFNGFNYIFDKKYILIQSLGNLNTGPFGTVLEDKSYRTKTVLDCVTVGNDTTYTSDYTGNNPRCSKFNSVNNKKALSLLKLYPNPASQNIAIEIPAPNGTLQIFNILGEMVYANNAISEKNFQLNIAFLTSGLYQVVYTSGTANFAGKLVVE